MSRMVLSVCYVGGGGDNVGLNDFFAYFLNMLKTC